MVQFISDQDVETKDPFEEYYNSVIVPMVEEDNKLKDKYRSQFWGYFWSILFLMGANVLVVLFNALMHKRPVSWEQLLIVNSVAAMIMFVPIYRYRNTPKKDIFDAFIQFYGGWKHLQNSEVKLVHSPIIPQHDAVSATHNVVGAYDGVDIEVRDTVYSDFVAGKPDRLHPVSSGIIVFLKFKEGFRGKILMFDKSGFYRKKKYDELEYITDKLQIPAANYFHIFTDNPDFAEDMLPALFFERVLDMKETFGTRHLNVEIDGNFLRMYFEGAQLYFDNYRFWSRKTDKNKFIHLNQEFEQIFDFISLVQVLQEKHD